MDVNILFVPFLLTVIIEAELKWIELCKFKYWSNCRWNGLYWICGNVSTLYCKKVIACNESTTINIIKVYYGTNHDVHYKYCPDVCNGDLEYSQPYTNSLVDFCNGKQVCELSQWNPNNYWRVYVNYDCKDRIYHRYTRKINTTTVKPRAKATSTQVDTSRPQPPQTTMSSRDARRVTGPKTKENNEPDSRPVKFPTEATKTQFPTTSPQPSQTTMSSSDTSRVTKSETKENNAPDTRPVKSQTQATKTQFPTTSPRASQTSMSSSDTSRVTKSETKENNAPVPFPLAAVSASVSAGIIVLVIVLIVLVCIKRRRRTIKSSQPDETTLQMQIVANNSYGISPSVKTKTDHQQETDEHAYVDITLQNATHATDGTSEQEYEYLNADKVLNKDINDEYNTLNTYPAPLQIDPNYDHIPKGSHTTVDETYSHVTDGETTMPDATYSHSKDTKSAASGIAQINQNNTDNVYNHINTKSVEENVYNNCQSSFNRSPSSNLDETKAVEDAYDHTDWKQTNTYNSKSKSSNNEAVGKFETKHITERARDEYAVVKKRSDKVESSDGHNYFVLEKQFL